MSEDTTSRSRSPRPSVKPREGEDTSIATATENALESISARVLDAEEATARAVARATEALSEAIAAAEASAERAVARLAETTRVADAAADRLAEAARTADAAADRAAAAAADRLAALVATAKGEGEAAFSGLSARIDEHVRAAEASLDALAQVTGTRLDAQAAQMVAQGEQVLQRLSEHRASTTAGVAGLRPNGRGRTALRGPEAAGVAMVDGISRARQQMADFVDSRVRQDLEVRSALLGCRSVGEMGQVHATFLRNAIAEYAAEANRLMQLGAEMVVKSTERSRL